MEFETCLDSRNQGSAGPYNTRNDYRAALPIYLFGRSCEILMMMRVRACVCTLLALQESCYFFIFANVSKHCLKKK
jgi:hypothetical protein